MPGQSCSFAINLRGSYGFYWSSSGRGPECVSPMGDKLKTECRVSMFIMYILCMMFYVCLILSSFPMFSTHGFYLLFVFVLSCSVVSNPWTVAHQVPLSMEFSRSEYWSGLPFPSPGDLPNPGIEPTSPLASGFFTAKRSLLNLTNHIGY